MVAHKFGVGKNGSRVRLLIMCDFVNWNIEN